MLTSILEKLVERFERELGFEGGRIYRREREDFILCCGFGASQNAPIGLRVPRDYPPHLRLLSEGLLVMRRGDPGVDPAFEERIGVSATLASIGVGEGNAFIIAYSIRDDFNEEQLTYSLSAVRHVINFKLQQQQMSKILEQSCVVQEVLLPAALLARDVITGLRMATTGVFEITRVVEGVNRLIHRAALSSKFVTMFLGVLEPDGVLAYCNAGHNPPLLLRGGTFEELDRGGTVLGPLGSARFQRAEVRLGPGDTLALFTDGLVERAGPGGEAYGTDRLRRLLLQGLSAAASVDAIFADCDAFGGGAPLEDDVTVIVVRKC